MTWHFHSLWLRRVWMSIIIKSCSSDFNYILTGFCWWGVWPRAPDSYRIVQDTGSPPHTFSGGWPAPSEAQIYKSLITNSGFSKLETLIMYRRAPMSITLLVPQNHVGCSRVAAAYTGVAVWHTGIGRQVLYLATSCKSAQIWHEYRLFLVTLWLPPSLAPSLPETC